MEPVIFSLLLAWALVRYGVTDLVATARGTESPRYRERRERMALRHERTMARIQTGPTIGQAVAGRIARRIAETKPPRDRSQQGAFRRFLRQWWEDSWNHATEARHSHYDRKRAGELFRQSAASACRHAFQQWRDHHAAAPADREGATSAATAAETGSATTTPPPAAPEERTAPIYLLAERRPLPETTPDTETQRDGFCRSIPDVLDPEGRASARAERNSLTMTDNHTMPSASGEVTNISSALDYTRAMAEQFTAAVGHVEALSAQAGEIADWANDSAATAETSIAGVTAGEVTGEAVQSLHAAHEQLTVAAGQVAEAHRGLSAALDQFAATAAAFEEAHAAFERQQMVAEAYSANPDAGSKQFNTYG